MSNRETKTVRPPPLVVKESAEELLAHATQLRAVAQGILARAGELIEVAEEMRRSNGGAA